MGSSPLARGLLSGQKPIHIPNRIIPARAGFTAGLRVGSSILADHPRSRGVYFCLAYSSAPISGSSPLARGLHAAYMATCGINGIIPARAGFTRAVVWDARCRKDHPRSRGVYLGSEADPYPQSGSSPLARGLRSNRLRRSPKRGIIPARAGFTQLLSLSHVLTRDHPRSRGVYTP